MGEQRRHEATFIDGQLVEGETSAQRWTRYLAQGGAILAGLYVIVQATILGTYLYGARAKADALEQYLVKQAQQAQAAQQATPAAPAPAKK
jgi:hypothetical protein